MSLIPVLLLSGDQALCDLVSDLLSDCDLTVGSCLGGCALGLSAIWLVIDPRWVKGCCINRLAAWRRKLDPRQVIFLPFPAAPEILLTLPRIVPGVVAVAEELPALIKTRLSRHQAEAAWVARDRIFDNDDLPMVIRSLVKLAREHDHENYSVRDAARHLAIGQRSLQSLSVAWTGFPPRIVLSLARVMSVASALRRERNGLDFIARAHKFPHSAAMSRLFLSYTRLRPGAFRGLTQAPIISENGILISEIGNGSSEPFPAHSHRPISARAEPEASYTNADDTRRFE